MEEDFGEDEGTMNAINYKDSIQGFGGNGDINAVNTDDLSDEERPGMHGGSLNPTPIDTVNTNPSSDSDMPGMNGGALNPVPVTTFTRAWDYCGFSSWKEFKDLPKEEKRKCNRSFKAYKATV